MSTHNRGTPPLTELAHTHLKWANKKDTISLTSLLRYPTTFCFQVPLRLSSVYKRTCWAMGNSRLRQIKPGWYKGDPAVSFI